MMYCEQTHARLAARHYLYGLFQALFGNEPSEQLLGAVDPALADDAFSLVLSQSSGEGDVRRFVRALETANEDMAAMERDYTRAFVGPHDLPAPPWESVYLGNKRLLLQASTLEVRDAYRSQGFVPERYPHIADDHLALELDFLARLAERALQAYVASTGVASADGAAASAVRDAVVDGSAECDAVFTEALEASRSFLCEHLLKWVPALNRDLAEWSGSSFYACASAALAVFVEADAEALARLEDGPKPV